MPNTTYTNQYNKVIIDGDVIIDLSSDTVAANKMLSGTTAHDKNGASITGSISSQSATAWTPTAAGGTIVASGKYLSGNITQTADSDFAAGNIKDAVQIWGVTGTFTHTTSAPLAGEILTGKHAWANGSEITGTMANKGSNNVTVTDKTGTTISAGYYNGSGKAVIDSTSATNLIAGNIKSGVTILGVEGTLTPSSDVTHMSKSATPTFSSQTFLPSGESPAVDYYDEFTVAAIPVAEASTTGTSGYTITVG